MLRDGKFLIPSFQRHFIWNPEHICNLWESIFLGYPVGSIIYWRTSIRLKIHQQLGGFYIPLGNEERIRHYAYILDGQQRATSLFITFYGGNGRVKDKPDFNYTLYFDLTNREFFFENELYQRRWITPDEFLIRLQDVPNLTADFSQQLAAVSGFNHKVATNFRQLQFIFTNYEISLLRLHGFNITEACDVYERINQNGIRLENLDILIARNFQNSPTVIEEDFPK